MFTDRYFSFLLILFSLIYLYFTSTLDSGFNAGPLGPKILPNIYGILLLILSITVFIQNEKTSIKDIKLKDIIVILIITLYLFIYAFIIEYLGFSLSTFLLSILCSKLFGASKKQSLLSSIIFTSSLVIIFVYLLDISLPIGSIFEQWTQ